MSNDARVSGTATVGVLTLKTALTPAVTALLAASGAASASTYLRGDGQWAGVSPPTYWDLETTYLAVSSTSTWTDMGLELAVTASAGDTVILNINMGSVYNCAVTVEGGLIGVVGGTLSDGLTSRGVDILSSGDLAASITFVDVPGAGTHTYKVRLRSIGVNTSCKAHSGLSGQWRGSTLFIQVLQ